MRIYRIIILFQKSILAVGIFLIIGLIHIPAMASDRFVNNGDGTVTDTETGLMWSTKCNGASINWKDASSYCQNYMDHGILKLPDFPPEPYFTSSGEIGGDTIQSLIFDPHCKNLLYSP